MNWKKLMGSPSKEDNAEASTANKDSWIQLVDPSSNFIDYDSTKTLEINGYDYIAQRPIIAHQVLSPEDCMKLINRSEEAGYVVALLNIGYGRQAYKPEVRNSWRVIQDDVDLSNLIWDRIKHLVPEYPGHVAVGLNERLRLLKYDTPGQSFRVHRDGQYRRPVNHPNAGDASKLTLLLYLNGGYEGCWTRVYHEGDGFVDVEPFPGMVLIHDHRYYHEATPLIDGCKYVIRTDIMFRAIEN